MKKQELSGRLRMLVVQAGRFAREFGHSYVGTEHLLLAISEEAGGAGRVLRAVGMEEPCLRSMVLAGAGIGSRTLVFAAGAFTQSAPRGASGGRGGRKAARAKCHAGASAARAFAGRRLYGVPDLTGKRRGTRLHVYGNLRSAAYAGASAAGEADQCETFGAILRKYDRKSGGHGAGHRPGARALRGGADSLPQE